MKLSSDISPFSLLLSLLIGGAGHAGGAGGAGSRRGLFPGPGGGGGGGRGGPGVSSEDRGSADLNEQIVVTLLRLQHDMSGVLNRLNSLEALVKEGRAVSYYFFNIYSPTRVSQIQWGNWMCSSMPCLDVKKNKPN